MSMTQELIGFIQENLLEGGDGSIDQDEALIDRGLLDSIGLMQIMQFVEDRAGVRIPDDEVTPDNFASVNSIDEMVRRLKGN